MSETVNALTISKLTGSSTPCCHAGCPRLADFAVCIEMEFYNSQTKSRFACDEHIPDAYNQAAKLAVVRLAKRLNIIENSRDLFEKFDAPLC